MKFTPGWFAWIKQRFDQTHISGLPLTLLVLLFLYVLVLLIGVIEDVVTSESIVRADVYLEQWFFTLRYPDAVTLFLWITLLCKSIVVSIVVTAVTILCVLWKKNSYAGPLLIGLLGAGSIVYIGKLVFQRARPEEFSVYTESLFSFPSGHAAIAVVLYGFIAYMLSENAKHWFMRIGIVIVTFCTIALIGISRLYLGVHYFSDVVGGYLLGLLWLMIAIGIREWSIRAYPTLDKHTIIQSRIRLYIISVITISIAVILYLIVANYYIENLLSTHAI